MAEGRPDPAHTPPGGTGPDGPIPAATLADATGAPDASLAWYQAKGASPVNGLIPPPEHRFRPGESGNLSGRPKLRRSPSRALAELNDTEGATPDEIITNFKAARGKALCAADFRAIALFRAESDPTCRTHVSASDSVMDRIEGKVTQPVAVDAKSYVVELPAKALTSDEWSRLYGPAAKQDG